MDDDKAISMSITQINDSKQIQQPTSPQVISFRVVKNKKVIQSALFSPQAQGLLLAKQEKKIAEGNLQQLNSRVQQLKLEDMKNQRTIKIAQKKTYSLIQSKTQSYLDKQLQLYNKSKLQEQHQERMEFIRQQKERERQAVETRKQQLEEKRQREIQFQSAYKDQVQEAIIIRKEQQFNECIQWLSQVKDHQQRLEEKKRKLEQNKLAQAEYNYRIRIEREIQEAKQAQEKLEVMEKEELEALNKYQATKCLQQSVANEMKQLKGKQ